MEICMALQCSLCQQDFDGRNAGQQFKEHLLRVEHIHPSLIEEGLQLAIDREALGLNIDNRKAYRRVMFQEALERLTGDRKHIEAGLRAMGHDTAACIQVEQALEWLIKQPITEAQYESNVTRRESSRA